MKKNSIRALQHFLTFKEEETTLRFLARLQGWIESKPLTQKSLLNALNTILRDLHSQEAENAQKALKINLNSIKNPLLKKYASEILELHLSGHGVRAIEKTLKLKHNVKISYSTIHRFLKQQGEN
jgi:YesN/AraC family two-component response regulator